MKKSLPKISKSPQGFTLIELLVVIAIIAVLATMGFTAYNGLTGRGNDDRRATDIKAFADAMEVARGSNSNYEGIALTGSSFAAGNFPYEPTSRTEKYCYTDGTAVIANPTAAAMTGTICPTGGGTGTQWMNVSGATPTVSAGATCFKFCTINEAKSAVICRSSRQ